MALKIRTKKKKEEVSVTFNLEADAKEQSVKDLQLIAKELNANELNKLAKAINNPFMKKAALAYLNNNL